MYSSVTLESQSFWFFESQRNSKAISIKFSVESGGLYRTPPTLSATLRQPSNRLSTTSTSTLPFYCIYLAPPGPELPSSSIFDGSSPTDRVRERDELEPDPDRSLDSSLHPNLKVAESVGGVRYSPPDSIGNLVEIAFEFLWDSKNQKLCDSTV
ncbi:hypothetical protein CROQUDRAFT_96420 [Cronartium quercuum f. sp. fusiforme G11]|uniref:Uncharacterized protein n=1 Tax=Cronartium quercuum f. sp. fusiforme G11 TaxID=708437 RepID=A0A9P6NCZ1_9BASI|nr:hypothetical protein CROQUDRAFT_96420 [Cronartium quercuum f. sp. fusiforme G11]